MPEIDKARSLAGSDLNSAKTILAFEATKLVHGQAAAEKALNASYGAFGGRELDTQILPSSTIPRESGGSELESIPTTNIEADRLRKGIPAFELFDEVGLSGSRGAARRLIQQGGAYVGGRRIETFDTLILDKHLKQGEILLRAGKKRYHRIRLKSK